MNQDHIQELERLLAALEGEQRATIDVAGHVFETDRLSAAVESAYSAITPPVEKVE